MTRDDIIRLAREAGAATGRHSPYQKNESIMPLCMDVERFAALVAAAEREACAKIADDEANDAMTAGEHNPKSNAAWNISMTAKRVADAIRARGSSNAG